MDAGLRAFTALPIDRRGALSASYHDSIGNRWITALVLYLPLMGATFFAKIGIPPFAAEGIGSAFLLMYAAILLGCLNGCMRLEPRRLTLFVMLTAILGVPQLLRAENFSLTSVLLFAVLHAPYIFAVYRPIHAPVPGINSTAHLALVFFLQVSWLLAWLGIGQYFLQFIIDAKWVFPIENLLPQQIVVKAFNSQGPLTYGSPLFRANGVFLLEPSFFSQLLAVAIVAELSTFNRLRRLLPYGLALVVSYSGTGLLILAVCLPLLILMRRRWDLFLCGALAWIGLLGLGEYLHMDIFVARAGEFNSTGSSAFQRFVGGFYLLDQLQWNDPWRTLFGFGAGSFRAHAAYSPYLAGEMPLFKMMFEFGLLGALAYFGFIFYCIFSGALPVLPTLAIAMTFVLSGNYVPFAHGLALSLLIWTSSASQQAPREANAEDADTWSREMPVSPHEGSP